MAEDLNEDPETVYPSNPVQNANIRLRRKAKPIAADGVINVGMDKPIQFPDEPTQRAGWYHPRANEIIKHLGDRYYRVKPLGK